MVSKLETTSEAADLVLGSGTMATHTPEIPSPDGPSEKDLAVQERVAENGEMLKSDGGENGTLTGESGHLLKGNEKGNISTVELKSNVILPTVEMETSDMKDPLKTLSSVLWKSEDSAINGLLMLLYFLRSI